MSQPDSLIAQQHFEEILGRVLHVTSMQELEEMIQVWRKGVVQVQLMAKSINKSVARLKSHVDGLARKEARKQRDADKRVENDAIARERRKAQEAVAKVSAIQIQAPPFFLMDFPALQAESVIEAVTIHNNLDGAQLNIDMPFIIKECAAITTWKDQAKMQVALSSFGGKYKKRGNFEADKKTQMPLYAREGKEESHTMFSAIVEAMPPNSTVDAKDTPAAATCDNIWLYGYHDKMQIASQSPNGLPLMKVLASGKVKWAMFQLTSLISALRQMLKKDSLNLDEIKDAILALNVDKMKKLKELGCIMKYATQNEWELIYQPVGWFAAEEVISGVLICGCRRTLILKSTAAYEQYEALTGVYHASKNPAHKHMEKILEKMEP